MKNSKYFLSLAIIPGLFFQSFGAYCYFVLFAQTQWVGLVYSSMKILLIGWPLLWLWLGYFSFKSGKQKQTKQSILWGLWSGAFIATLIFIVFSVWQDFFFQFSPQISQKVDYFGLNNVLLYFAFGLGMSLIHSFLEEYYWRWFIFKGLKDCDLSFLWAALISSAGFAAHHFIILFEFFPGSIALPFGVCVGIGGFVWSFIFHRTNSLLGAWISHFLVDTVIFFIGWLMVF